MEWQPITLATVGSLTLLSPSKSLETQSPQEIQQVQDNAARALQGRAAAYPNRIEIAVNITDHSDLKIVKDMAISKAQIAIAFSQDEITIKEQEYQ